jgi:hypothetical protein
MSRYAGDQINNSNNVDNITANYRRVITGSQLGTPQLQALLIKTQNEDWGTLTTDPLTQNPNIKVSESNSTFSRIVRAVQDYAEIYFIGNPQTNAGGESNKTECVIWINSNTHTGGAELSSEGRWAALENHIHVAIPTFDQIWVYYGVPDGWIWRAGGVVATQNDYGDGWFPVIDSASGPQALAVVVQGSGSGTVTSSPVGINGQSIVTYAYGTIVTLTASPALGSVFVGWSGAASGTGAAAITMNSNQIVIARFDLAAPPP